MIIALPWGKVGYPLFNILDIGFLGLLFHFTFIGWLGYDPLSEADDTRSQLQGVANMRLLIFMAAFAMLTFSSPGGDAYAFGTKESPGLQKLADQQAQEPTTSGKAAALAKQLLTDQMLDENPDLQNACADAKDQTACLLDLVQKRFVHAHKPGPTDQAVSLCDTPACWAQMENRSTPWSDNYPAYGQSTPAHPPGVTVERSVTINGESQTGHTPGIGTVTIDGVQH